MYGGLLLLCVIVFLHYWNQTVYIRHNETFVVHRTPQTAEVLAKLQTLRTKTNALIARLKANGSHEFDRLVRVYPSIVYAELSKPAGDQGPVAYSKNKTIIRLCVRNVDGSFVSDDALMYVAVHELAHCALSNYDPEAANGRTQHSQSFIIMVRQLYDIAISAGLLNTAGVEHESFCGQKII